MTYDRSSSWKPTPVKPEMATAVLKMIAAAEAKMAAYNAVAEASKQCKKVDRQTKGTCVAVRDALRGMGDAWYDEDLSRETQSALYYGLPMDVDSVVSDKTLLEGMDKIQRIIENLKSILP